MKRVTIVSLLLCLLILITACTPGSIGFKAQIYSVDTDKRYPNPDTYTYIKSVDELQTYYEASYYNEFSKEDGLKYVKEKVRDNKKYNDEFFKNHCLLIIYHMDEYPFSSGHKVRSVVFQDDMINIDIYRGYNGAGNAAITEYHIVIELDVKYADKEVKATYS